jgi:predicted nucleic acid-binding protein
LTVYLETSAVLARLLGESRGKEVDDWLGRVDVVATSQLTLVECRRALVRLVATGHLDHLQSLDLRAHLEGEAALWTLHELQPDVLERAGWPFPAEPLRALDALHLASALTLRMWMPDLEMLSLDHRVRQAATLMGCPVVPAQGAV